MRHAARARRGRRSNLDACCPLLVTYELPGRPEIVEGGPEAYQKQQKACADGLNYVQNAIVRWSAQPDKLSLMLETLIRIESMDQQAISLSQGVRKYHNPAVADILDSMLNSLSGDLEWLRSQSLDMAQQREKELDVAQKEAQRCRSQILQPHSQKK